MRRWQLLVFLAGLVGVARAGDFAPLGSKLSESPTAADFARILQRFPRYAELGWHQGHAGDASLGWFGDGRSDENGQRTLANFILTYAWLAALPSYDPAVSGVPQETVRAHALAALRYMVRTHVTGDLRCTDDKPWGNHWQSAWWTSKMMGGVTRLEPWLTDADRQRVDAVVQHEADRHIGLPPRVGEYGDTKSEENAWDSEVMAWALARYPDHPHAAAWRDAFDTLCLNTFAVAADLSSEQRYRGRPLKDWIGGPCIHDDFTIENHGSFHICYMICPLHSFAWDVYVFRSHGLPVPASVWHHTRDVWERTKQFALWDGRFAYAGGKDWPRYAYGLYFILPALVMAQDEWADGEARLLERQRVGAFEYEQRIWNDGSFFSGRFTKLQMTRWPSEWETDCAANLTIAAMFHEIAKTPPPVTPAALAADKVGGFVSPTAEMIVQRDPARFVSWCWKPNQAPATGLFSSDRHPDMMEWDRSLCGEVALQGLQRYLAVGDHREIQFPGGFATVGEIRHGQAPRPPSPYRLELQDDNLPTTSIAAPAHPLFNRPETIEALTGLTDADSVKKAGEAWQVLATNRAGGPSLLEARVGEGRVLVNMTNAEEKAVGGLEVAQRLIRNLIAYVGASDRECGYLPGQNYLRDALQAEGVKLKSLRRPKLAELQQYPVVFVDRNVNGLAQLYPELLAYARAGGQVVQTVLQDEGWNPETISERPVGAISQALAFIALPDERTAVLIERWQAEQPGQIAALDMLRWPIANDIFNVLSRRFATADPTQPVLDIRGAPAEAEVTPVAGRFVTIDGDLAAVAASPGWQFELEATAGRAARHGSIAYTLVRLRPASLDGTSWRGAVVLRTACDADDARQLADGLGDQAVSWDGDRATMTVPGADGRRYEIAVDLGAGRTATVRGR